MELRRTLEERQDTIVRRWLDEVLAAYPADGGAFFKRGPDRFTNPVGHSAREGTRLLFSAFLAGGDEAAGGDAETVSGILRNMLRIRAVQEMPPSTAVGFVLALKAVVRRELDAAETSALGPDLEELDRRIDRLALTAFDIYVEHREELAAIRVREVRRKVSWIVDRLNRGREPAATIELE